MKEDKNMKKLVKVIAILTAVMSLCLAATACNTAKGQAKVITIKLTEEEYAFGVDKNNAQLLSDVNSIIAKIKADGTMDSIMNKYFAGEEVTGITSATKDDSKNQLVVATNAAFAPFEYKIGDKFAGIDMEIAKIIADELGMELVIDNMEFDSVVLSVGSGKCDIAMAGLTVNEKRKESVNFSDSYYNASQMIIVKADDTTFDGCTTAAEVEAILKSLSGKKAGAQNGTTGKYYLEGDADWGFDGYSNITTVGFSNGALAVKDMFNGNIDFVVIDEMPAKTIVANYNK